MLWYAELAVESFLLAILWYRHCPRWFGTLIGIDSIAQILQIIFYRANLVEFARIFSRTGYVLVAVATVLALTEAADLEPSRFRWWHIRILASWVCGELLCGWMEVGQHNPVIFWWNGVLLAVQLVAFAAWIVLVLSTQREQRP